MMITLYPHSYDLDSLRDGTEEGRGGERVSERVSESGGERVSESDGESGGTRVIPTASCGAIGDVPEPCGGLRQPGEYELYCSRNSSRVITSGIEVLV